MMRPPSSMVGTTPLGFILRYQGWSLPPNGPPTSSRSYFTPHSSAAHNTFITLIELARPQIFIALASTFLAPPQQSWGDGPQDRRGHGAQSRCALTLRPRRRGHLPALTRREGNSMRRRPGGADAGVDDQRHRELGGTFHHAAGDLLGLVDLLVGHL